MAIPEVLASSIKKTIQPTSTPQQTSSGGVRWVDPTWTSIGESANPGGNAILTYLAASNRRNEANMLGSVEQAAAAKRAVFDTKAMGLPEGFEANFADVNPYTGEYADPNKLRLTKKIAGGGYINYDAFKQDNGTLKLSKPWVSAPTGTMRDFWSKVITGASIIFPGLGSGIGSALGASGATAAMAGNAVLGAASAKVAGADTGGVLRSAAGGAVTGAVGNVSSGLVNAGLSPAVANVAARTGTGAVSSLIKGGNPLVGALLSNLKVDSGNQAVNPILNYLIRSQIQQQLLTKKPGG